MSGIAATGFFAIYEYYRINKKHKKEEIIKYVGYTKPDSKEPPTFISKITRGMLGNPNIVFPIDDDDKLLDD